MSIDEHDSQPSYHDVVRRCPSCGRSEPFDLSKALDEPMGYDYCGTCYANGKGLVPVEFYLSGQRIERDGPSRVHYGNPPFEGQNGVGG